MSTKVSYSLKSMSKAELLQHSLRPAGTFTCKNLTFMNVAAYTGQAYNNAL